MSRYTSDTLPMPGEESTHTDYIAPCALTSLFAFVPFFWAVWFVLFYLKNNANLPAQVKTADVPQPATLFKRTRIAPTPSGFLHLGNVMSFALTAAMARENGAEILLRIDDMDRARADKRYIQDIFNTLNFLEIPWDEGPRNAAEFGSSFSQLHRMAHYEAAISRLRDTGSVFACTCSRQQLATQGYSCECAGRGLPLDTPGACWRLLPRNEGLAVKSYDKGIIHTALPADMHNFIVRKKDGFPSYQLTSVTDDLFFEVDLVVRGLDLWPSTLAQHQLAQALGNDTFKEITFYHHALLMEAPGKKLSKSAGATSVHYLREKGKTAAAIYTLIASMLGANEPVTNWRQLTSILKPGAVRYGI